MNQYPNYNYGYQQQNPYMQRMENLQQFQQALMQPAMQPTIQPNNTFQFQNQYAPLIKIVDGLDMVKVADIPMDGNVYYFPKADGSEIYSKQFMPNGQTRILTFKPLSEDEPNNLPSSEEKGQITAFKEFLEGIQEDIKTLNDKVDKLSKPNRAKKEVLEDE